MNKGYFLVSPARFIVFSAFTFGIYNIYWAYKNWSYIREREQSSISPFWRAIFHLLWFYPLLSNIAQHSSTPYLKNIGIKVFLTASYVIIDMLSESSVPFMMLWLLIPLPLLPAVLALAKDGDCYTSRGHNIVWTIPVVLIGIPVFAFIILSSFNYLPSTSVVSGSQMWNKDIDFLRKEEILDENEEILYFYTTELLSIADDGQFISNCCIVSYFKDSENSELIINYSYYEDIENISVVWSTSDDEVTVVTITEDDESSFEVWLSRENEGDKQFITELKKQRKAARPSEIYPNSKVIKPIETERCDNN
ncbi:MAG: hypothetical protein V3V18_08610 [Methylococcales bacterium]